MSFIVYIPCSWFSCGAARWLELEPFQDKHHVARLTPRDSDESVSLTTAQRKLKPMELSVFPLYFRELTEHAGCRNNNGHTLAADETMP
jgi:hypothetical protein